MRETLEKYNIPFVQEDMKTILLYSSLLIVLAILSLTFGYLAGKNCAIASCGLGKNLRHDLYYNVQRTNACCIGFTGTGAFFPAETRFSFIFY